MPASFCYTSSKLYTKVLTCDYEDIKIQDLPDRSFRARSDVSRVRVEFAPNLDLANLTSSLRPAGLHFKRHNLQLYLSRAPLSIYFSAASWKILNDLEYLRWLPFVSLTSWSFRAYAPRQL